jgi:hypothetical protein
MEAKYLMTTPIERKLPGDPVSREELVRQFEDLERRNRDPVERFLFEAQIPKPEDTYQWRVELDCGCIRDAVTRGDDVERLLARSDSYYFGIGSPSQREIAEADARAGEEAEEAARAKFDGRERPLRAERPSIWGKAKLPAGQWMCWDPQCAKYCRGSGPVRDIVEWVRLHDDLRVMEPLEIDGVTLRGEESKAMWDVVLSCGHFSVELTEPGWKPEDGPVREKRIRPLSEILAIFKREG